MTMGLIDWWRVRRMDDAVRGKLFAEFGNMGMFHIQASSWTALVDGVVTAPGLPRTAVRISTTIHRNRISPSRKHVPVIVDRANPSKVVILWKEVPKRNYAAELKATPPPMPVWRGKR